MVVAAHRYAGKHTFYWLAENGDSAGGVTNAGGLNVSVRAKGYPNLPRGSARISQQVRITPKIYALFEIITYINPKAPNLSVYGEHYEPIASTVHLLVRRRMSSGETVEIWGAGDVVTDDPSKPKPPIDYAETQWYALQHIAPVDPRLYDKLSDFQKGK